MQSTPNPKFALNKRYNLWSFSGVSCSSANACIAVASYATERWNGTKWTLLPTPFPPSAFVGQWSSYFKVSCPSANACIAVGVNGTVRWNGKKWMILHNHPGLDVQELSCTSANACIVVGRSLRSDNLNRASAERWNGRNWRRLPIASVSGFFDGVSCTSVNACVAVGGATTDNASSFPGPWAASWDGNTWTTQQYILNPTTFNVLTPQSPQPSPLSGVSCASATACVAVGYFTIIHLCSPVPCMPAPATYATLVERYG